MSLTPQSPLSNEVAHLAQPAAGCSLTLCRGPNKIQSGSPSKYFKHYKQITGAITIKSERYGPLLMEINIEHEDIDFSLHLISDCKHGLQPPEVDLSLPSSCCSFGGPLRMGVRYFKGK